MKLLQNKKDSFSLIAAILFLILGVILISNPGGVINFITYIIGGIIILLGLAKLLSYYKNKKNEEFNNTNNLTIGVVLCVFGIIIMFCANAIEFLIRIIMGGWLLYAGIMKLILALSLKKLNVKNWNIALISSIVLLICGLYTVIVTNVIGIAGGIILVIYSISEIIQYVIIPKQKNEEIIK